MHFGRVFRTVSRFEVLYGCTKNMFFENDPDYPCLREEMGVKDVFKVAGLKTEEARNRYINRLLHKSIMEQIKQRKKSHLRELIEKPRRLLSNCEYKSIEYTVKSSFL